MKYDMGMQEEVDVPKGIVEFLQNVGVEGCKMDCEKCDAFEDCLHDFIYEDRFDIYSDNIYPEDIAEFIIDYISQHGPWYYERPTFSTRMEVGEWVVIAYGAVPPRDYSSGWEPEMLAYRKSMDS